MMYGVPCGGSARSHSTQDGCRHTLGCLDRVASQSSRTFVRLHRAVQIFDRLACDLNGWAEGRNDWLGRSSLDSPMDIRRLATAPQTSSLVPVSQMWETVTRACKSTGQFVGKSRHDRPAEPVVAETKNRRFFRRGSFPGDAARQANKEVVEHLAGQLPAEAPYTIKACIRLLKAIDSGAFVAKACHEFQEVLRVIFVLLELSLGSLAQEGVSGGGSPQNKAKGRSVGCNSPREDEIRCVFSRSKTPTFCDSWVAFALCRGSGGRALGRYFNASALGPRDSTGNALP